MIQGKVKEIQKIDSYKNKKGIDIHIFDVSVNDKLYQWHTTDIKHERFQVGEVVSFETELVEGSNYKYYKIRPEKKKGNAQYNYKKSNVNSANYKALDLAAIAQTNAIKILLPEINSTLIDNVQNSELLSKITELTERLYDDIRTISKLNN